MDIKHGTWRNTTSTAQILVPRSVRQVSELPTVTPSIAWTTNGRDERTFVIDRKGDPSNTSRFSDGVLGILVLAYLAPEIRQQWPKALSIGDSREQPIGAAQVPVLALFPGNQKKLLKSRLVQVAEGLAI